MDKDRSNVGSNSDQIAVKDKKNNRGIVGFLRRSPRIEKSSSETNLSTGKADNESLSIVSIESTSSQEKSGKESVSTRSTRRKDTPYIKPPIKELNLTLSETDQNSGPSKTYFEKYLRRRTERKNKTKVESFVYKNLSEVEDRCVVKRSSISARNSTSKSMFRLPGAVPDDPFSTYSEKVPNQSTPAVSSESIFMKPSTHQGMIRTLRSNSSSSECSTQSSEEIISDSVDRNETSKPYQKVASGIVDATNKMFNYIRDGDK